MDVRNYAQYDQAVSGLNKGLRTILLHVPHSAKEAVFEIRLRLSQPLSLISSNGCWFVDEKSQLNNIPRSCYSVTQSDISDSILSMCSYSLHNHQQELKNGYISLQGGHRAGVCGSAVEKDGEITTVRDITSVNIRVARDIKGAATPLMHDIFSKELCGVLIVGPPSSGKTTILRDLARQLSSGVSGKHVKVAVIDERCEIAAIYNGVPQNNLGPCCDILSGYPKATGILTAVRTLSPQVIICDEIGTNAEAQSMLDGMNCGVHIIASAHATSIQELLLRQPIMTLIKSKAFKKIVWLHDSSTPGCVRQIIGGGELYNEINRDGANSAMLVDDRKFSGFSLNK